MQIPYTDRYPEVVAVASQCTAAALSVVLWRRPLRTRATTGVLTAAIWVAALFPVAQDVVKRFGLNGGPADQLTSMPAMLQLSATLATMAAFFSGPRRYAALAMFGQLALLALMLHLRESDYELMFAHLLFYGALIGVNAEKSTPRAAGPPLARRTAILQDAIIFLVTVVGAAILCELVFDRLIYNGDEVAYTYQADVFARFRAYGPVPPCLSMFDNFWVFHLDGRRFSQYAPGWPLFMAPFRGFGVVWLAGPVMAGIAAVGIARLSRRCAVDLGSTSEQSSLIVRIAGPLGALLAMLGPSMALNGASRFPHTMVVACFAWAAESACALGETGRSRRSAWLYGLLLGTAAALGPAARPPDGATLGVGFFLYFAWLLVRRRIGWAGFLGTAISFALFGGLTLIILRLQLGEWFKTGYHIMERFHYWDGDPLSWPKPNEVKYAVPLSTGSYCWWPATPALGLAGLIVALGRRERRVPFMLVISGLAMNSFYWFVEFGRAWDNGLGPRYYLPHVVPMAVGSAAILGPIIAPLVARMGVMLERSQPPIGQQRLLPALLLVSCFVYGIYRFAPRTYPIEAREHHRMVGPLLALRERPLKNAIVIVEKGKVPADDWNTAQNDPMDPNPDVLMLIRHNEAELECARQHFPGRTWYRAGMTEIVPY
jgi:hypothetical protein